MNGPESGHAAAGVLTRSIHRAHESMFGLAGHADWYDRGPGRLAAPLYRRIAADVAGAGLPDGALVVDVGTGPGRVPLLIAQRCPTLVVEGVDLSEEMIDRASRAAAGSGRGEHLVYRVGDVRALPYPDGSVDLVVSSLSLHHWTDVPRGLAEIRRVLRPGAQAWIYDVRPVLARVAVGSSARGLDIALHRLPSDPAAGVRSRIVTAIGRRFVGRLTLTAPAASS